MSEENKNNSNNNNNQLYREKSLERIDSPKKLDEYLKVTSPNVWITLLAIIILIIGFVAWAIVGEIGNGTEMMHPIEFLIH